MDRSSFTKALGQIGVSISTNQLDQSEIFEVELYRRNEVMNLTRVPQAEAWLRHFVDSLLFQDLIPEGSSVLDIGTGPGFPSWPLACARPDLQVTAIDSSGKMLTFLKSQPLPNLSVVQTRAEDWGVREAFDVVTGRALAPLAIQLELSAPLTKVGGKVIPMRTPQELADIQKFPGEKLGLTLVDLHLRELPGTDVERLFGVFEKVESTPTKFPRTWSEIKKKPIG